MRLAVLSLASVLASGVGAGACADPVAEVVAPPAPEPTQDAAPPSPARASVVAASGPGPATARVELSVHVVATRPGPLALEVDEAMELLRASVEIVELVDDGPLVRDALALAGMRELLGGWNPRFARDVRLAARWPHFAMLSIELPDEGAIEGRGALWDGARWRRDDASVGALRQVHRPIGPDALGTVLTRVEVYDERGSDPDDPRLRRARPKALVRRMADASRRRGPREPEPGLSPWATLASSTSGHVFAGDRSLSVWSPDHGAWTTTAMPGRGDVTAWGFRVFAPDDVLVMGGHTYGPWLAHYDGARWNDVVGPPCTNAIVRVARHEHRLWVLCGSDRAMPVSPRDPKWLWTSDGTGRWTPMTIARRDDAPHVVDVVARDRDAPLEGFAPSDLASTKSGTLWMVAGEFSADGSLASEERWLLRAGAAAPVLQLPGDVELAAELPE